MSDMFEEMRKMQRDMDRMFSSFFRMPEQRLPTKGKGLSLFRAPLTDIEETKDKVKASIELPGMEKEDIDLNVTDDYIEIRAERKKEAETEKKGMYKYERSYKGFSRTLPLPCEVDADQANAEYKNGILTVTIPKKRKVEEKKKKIQIK